MHEQEKTPRLISQGAVVVGVCAGRNCFPPTMTRFSGGGIDSAVPLGSEFLDYRSLPAA